MDAPRSDVRKITGDDLSKILAPEIATISDCIAIFDKSAAGVFVITDASGAPAGFVDDDSFRNAQLRELSPGDPVSKIANRQFAILRGAEESLQQDYITVRVGDDGRPVELFIQPAVYLNNNSTNAPIRTAIVMAGGLGERMGALTQDRPKSLIPVAGRPLIEHVLRLLAKHKIMNVIIATNYLADQIEAFVGCGAKFGVSVQYIREPKRLGTAGALSIIESLPNEPIFVMNADVLTKLNLTSMARRHIKTNAMLTVAVAPHVMECPYGVTRLKGSEIIDISEKPAYKHWINAGIYIISPAVAARVPRNTYIDMTTMIQQMIQSGEQVEAFPIREYWHDAGTPDDVARLSAELKNTNIGNSES
ncbi:MAG: sugar phosphate nucleotidyltransferase [Planctomycetota bacterium]